jgi:hypothetical protein
MLSFPEACVLLSVIFFIAFLWFSLGTNKSE